MYGTPQFGRRGPGTYLTGAPLSRRRRGRRCGLGASSMGSLAAITPLDAAKQVFPNAPRSSSAGHNMATFNAIVASAQAGQMVDAQGAPAYVPGTGACAGANMLKPVLTSTVSGLALKFAPQAFVAGPIVGGIVLAIGALSAIFSVVFGHHAAAVKKEQSILCAAVPAANQSLQLIDEAISSGQATPQQAMDAIDSLVSGFRSAIAPILHGADPTVSGECNAACVMLSQLRAIALVKKSQYQDLADAQAAQAAAAAANPVAAAISPVTGAVQSVQAAVASAGLPAWLLPAAGFFVLWKFL